MDGPKLQVFIIYVYHIKINMHLIIASLAALLAVMFKTTQRNTHGKILQVHHKSFLESSQRFKIVNFSKQIRSLDS